MMSPLIFILREGAPHRYPRGKASDISKSFFLPLNINLSQIISKRKLRIIKMSSRVLRSSARRSEAPENLMTPQKKVPRTPAKKDPEADQIPKFPISPTDQMLTPPASNRKRKASTDVSSQVNKKTQMKKQKKEKEEKRERKFRAEPPQSFHSIYNRAISQRFYVLNRTRCGTEACPEEDVEMTGSTGNIYTVHIGKRLRCTCPHHTRGGHQCKHILFVSLTLHSFRLY
jgi:hypothetical protein